MCEAVLRATKKQKGIRLWLDAFCVVHKNSTGACPYGGWGAENGPLHFLLEAVLKP